MGSLRIFSDNEQLFIIILEQSGGMLKSRITWANLWNFVHLLPNHHSHEPNEEEVIPAGHPG